MAHRGKKECGKKPLLTLKRHCSYGHGVNISIHYAIVCLIVFRRSRTWFLQAESSDTIEVRGPRTTRIWRR